MLIFLTIMAISLCNRGELAYDFDRVTASVLFLIIFLLNYPWLYTVTRARLLVLQRVKLRSTLRSTTRGIMRRCHEGRPLPFVLFNIHVYYSSLQGLSLFLFLLSMIPRTTSAIAFLTAAVSATRAATTTVSAMSRMHCCIIVTTIHIGLTHLVADCTCRGA